MGARAGKYKFGAGAGKYKLGVRAGGQGPSKWPGAGKYERLCTRGDRYICDKFMHHGFNKDWHEMVVCLACTFQFIDDLTD